MSRLWLQKMLAVFIGILVVFIVGEIVYRAYVYLLKPLYRPGRISGLLWEPTPGADVMEGGVRYQINSRGLRDSEYTLEKPEGVFRIAVVGDSVTWGYTELQDTYPKLIEEKLRRLYPHRRFEVLNFGIEGTGPRHHLAVLKERVLQYDPDLVILGHCLNDLLDDMRFEHIGPATLCFLQHSYFADFIVIKAITLARVLRARAGIMTGERYYRDSIRLYEDRARLSAIRGILREMNKLLKYRGVNFAFVILPFKQQFDLGAAAVPQEKLSEICLSERILYLDLLKELKQHNVDGLYLKGDPIHFSPLGNDVAANSILGFLLSRDLIMSGF